MIILVDFFFFGKSIMYAARRWFTKLILTPFQNPSEETVALVEVTVRGTTPVRVANKERADEKNVVFYKLDLSGF